MTKHLIFFDDTCGLCQRSVKLVASIDWHHIFAFTPLTGKTADEILTDDLARYRGLNTFILIENFREENRKVWIYGKGVLRTLWLLDSGWQYLGTLHCLPKFIVDPIYRMVARRRRPDTCAIPKDERFLP